MVDQRYTKHAVLDASPLIYLAKIRAMDVFESLAMRPLVPSAVAEETTRPALLYRHPDAALIEQALREGVLEVVEPGPSEGAAADALGSRVPALQRGECEVLAIATERRAPAVLFERRARNVARAMGVELLDVTELLIYGTPEDELLKTRFRELAQLVNMRLVDYESLTQRILRRRLP